MSPLRGISERETSGESAGKSATIALLSPLISSIRKSDKTSSQILSEYEHNSKIPIDRFSGDTKIWRDSWKKVLMNGNSIIVENLEFMYNL